MLSAHILRTFLSRCATAGISLLIVVLCSRELGAEGMGKISLLVLAITIISLVTGLWGGAGLVYLTPRHANRHLLGMGYVWSLLGSVLCTLPLYVFNLYPEEFGWHVALLGALVSAANVNMYLLLGRERIKAHNAITLLQSVALALVVIVHFYVLHGREVMVYLWGMYASHAMVFSASFLVLWRSRSGGKHAFSWLETGKATFRYSFQVQLGSVMQLLNYRLPYYLIEHVAGLGVLGKFSVAVQVAEAIWIIARSVSLVLYSKISNLADKAKAAEWTLLLFKANLLATFVALLVLLCIPSVFFMALFGKDFDAVKLVLLGLAPGILAVAGTTQFSTYFSGVGKIGINVWGSFIGLLATLAFGVLLVTFYGIMGAAVTCSVSYVLSLGFAWWVFYRQTHFPAKVYLPQATDWQKLKGILKGFTGNQ